MRRFLIVCVVSNIVGSCAAPQASEPAVAVASAPTPPTQATPRRQPLEDLGGRVFRAEADGFKVLVHWWRGRFELRGCHPQFGCGPPYCTEKGFTEFPALVTCDVGGTLAFSQTSTGYRMTVGGEFLNHFQHFDPQARKLIPIAPGPTTFEMVRVSPLATALEDEAFSGPQYVPNSSPETNALGALAGARAKARLPDVNGIAELLRELGVDPETVPLETAESIRSAIEERGYNGGITLELDSLKDTIDRELDDVRPR